MAPRVYEPFQCSPLTTTHALMLTDVSFQGKCPFLKRKKALPTLQTFLFSKLEFNFPV